MPAPLIPRPRPRPKPLVIVVPQALSGLGDVSPLPYIGAAAIAAGIGAAYAKAKRKDPATYAIFAGGATLVAALVTYNVRGGT